MIKGDPGRAGRVPGNIPGGPREDPGVEPQTATTNAGKSREYGRAPGVQELKTFLLPPHTLYSYHLGSK